MRRWIAVGRQFGKPTSCPFVGLNRVAMVYIPERNRNPSTVPSSSETGIEIANAMATAVAGCDRLLVCGVVLGATPRNVGGVRVSSQVSSLADAIGLVPCES